MELILVLVAGGELAGHLGVGVAPAVPLFVGALPRHFCPTAAAAATKAAAAAAAAKAAAATAATSSLGWQGGPRDAQLGRSLADLALEDSCGLAHR